MHNLPAAISLMTTHAPNEAASPANRHAEARTSREMRIQAVSKDIFEHARNLLTCATLLALGVVARNRPRDLFGSSLLEGAIGWGVITGAAVLGLLNLWTGTNRLKQWKHWKLWSGVMLAAYVLVAARVLEVMALIRLGAH